MTFQSSLAVIIHLLLLSVQYSIKSATKITTQFKTNLAIGTNQFSRRLWRRLVHNLEELLDRTKYGDYLVLERESVRALLRHMLSFSWFNR